MAGKVIRAKDKIRSGKFSPDDVKTVVTHSKHLTGVNRWGEVVMYSSDKSDDKVIMNTDVSQFPPATSNTLIAALMKLGFIIFVVGGGYLLLAGK